MTPSHCRLTAFQLLEEHLDELDSPRGLLVGAVAVSRHEIPDADVEAIGAEFDAMAERIRERVRSQQPKALLAHAHAYLFDELGFAGDEDDYYNPRNSYLPEVLERKRGLPITLALVYRQVLDRLGIAVHGINAQGHFLVAVEMDGRTMLVDPFFRGRLVTVEEAIERARQFGGPNATVPSNPLPLATHREWLRRLVRNLRGVFAARNRRRDASAMEELLGLLSR